MSIPGGFNEAEALKPRIRLTLPSDRAAKAGFNEAEALKPRIRPGGLYRYPRAGVLQ